MLQSSFDVNLATPVVCGLFLFLMIRRPPRSTLDRSSAASDVYKRQAEEVFQQTQSSLTGGRSSDVKIPDMSLPETPFPIGSRHPVSIVMEEIIDVFSRMGFEVAEDREIEDDWHNFTAMNTCLLYTSDAADERSSVDLGGRRIIKKKTSITDRRDTINTSTQKQNNTASAHYRHDVVSTRAGN